MELPDKELVISEFSKLLKEQKCGIIYMDKLTLEVCRRLDYMDYLDKVTEIVQESFIWKV